MVPFPVYLDESNVKLLDSASFVFVCMDTGPAERAITKHVQLNAIPFVDLGTSIDLIEETSDTDRYVEGEHLSQERTTSKAE